MGVGGDLAASQVSVFRTHLLSLAITVALEVFHTAFHVAKAIAGLANLYRNPNLFLALSFQTVFKTGRKEI
jgi:hypothetical protein